MFSEQDVGRREFPRLPGQIGKQVVSVNVIFVGSADRIVTLLQLFHSRGNLDGCFPHRFHDERLADAAEVVLGHIKGLVSQPLAPAQPEPLLRLVRSSLL